MAVVFRIWGSLLGMATTGLEAIRGNVLLQFNLEILCNVWKPAHQWLAP